MSKIRDLIGEFRVVPIVGATALVGMVIYLVSNYPDPTLQDGITFEEDGTALTGRESGEGWLDLKCKSGEVVVGVVNDYAWEIVDEGSFPDDACDDNKLKPGELSMGDIPENLRG